jgi:N-acyl-D-aspartate/D-glutamate deacylase
MPPDQPRPSIRHPRVGYQSTVCNGTVILRDDERTGARAGRVLRNPASRN